MNKTLYNTSMDKVKMSEECEKRIIEAAENAVTDKNYHKSFRFIPVIAAAAVLLTGTICVAADNEGFNWIKGFFNEKDFIISNDIADMIADIENFNCESPCGMEISPVGMLAEETSIYCMLKVDNLPENINLNDIRLSKFYTDKSNTIEAASNMTSFLENYKYDNNTLMLTVSTSYKAFNDGDTITIVLGPDFSQISDLETDKYAEINFKVNFGNPKSLEVNYDEYKAVEVLNSKFFIDNMLVTPLKITTNGTKLFHDGMTINNDIKVVMKDETVVTAVFNGKGITGDCKDLVNTQKVIADWIFEEPINPDNISAIYMKELCLYKQ